MIIIIIWQYVTSGAEAEQAQRESEGSEVQVVCVDSSDPIGSGLAAVGS
jgi:hypothetical protein